VAGNYACIYEPVFSGFNVALPTRQASGAVYFPMSVQSRQVFKVYRFCHTATKFGMITNNKHPQVSTWLLVS